MKAAEMAGKATEKRCAVHIILAASEEICGIRITKITVWTTRNIVLPENRQENIHKKHEANMLPLHAKMNCQQIC